MLIKSNIHTLYKLSSFISSRTQVATAIAILFHTVGLVGILVFKSDLIIQSTPVNLLLSFGLLIWTQQLKSWPFWLFLLVCCVTGFLVEVVGVNTGYLFGNYSYGKVLGVQFKSVPLMIGVNWFIVMYCCGVFIHTFMQKLMNTLAVENREPPGFMKLFSAITDSATLAVALDWLMEPVAIKLGFWKWGDDGTIPFYNYLCWFVISLLLMALFHLLPISRKNNFAVNLLLIQSMFFLLLRTFL